MKETREKLVEKIKSEILGRGYKLTSCDELVFSFPDDVSSFYTKWFDSVIMPAEWIISMRSNNITIKKDTDGGDDFTYSTLYDWLLVSLPYVHEAFEDERCIIDGLRKIAMLLNDYHYDVSVDRSGRAFTVYEHKDGLVKAPLSISALCNCATDYNWTYRLSEDYNEETVMCIECVDIDQVSRSDIARLYNCMKRTLATAAKNNNYLLCQQLDNCDKGGTNMAQLGVITEQGDLGLGFNPLNEKDNKVVNESVRSSMNKTEENENDEK